MPARVWRGWVVRLHSQARQKETNISDLPTREELKSEADYAYIRTDNEVSRYTTLLTKLSNAYIDKVLMTREEWFDSTHGHDNKGDHEMTTARQLSVISKTPNGWCSVKMRVTPATNHVTTDRLFGWRVQTVECHSQNLTVASEYDVPMWFDEHGDARSESAQCGVCGSRYAATFTEGDQHE